MLRLFRSACLQLCLAGLFSCAVFGTQVTIADSGSGTALSTIVGAGSLSQVKVSWPGFTAADGTVVSSGSIIVSAPSSSFSVNLTSNYGTSALYTFTFYVVPPGSYANRVYSALVVIPASGTATLAQCQVTAPWYTSGVSGGGGSSSITTILGIPFAATMPTDGQAWLYNAGNNDLEPVAIPYWKKYTVGFGSLTTFGSTGTINLLSRPARQKVCGIAMYVSTAFAGSSITGLTVTIGDSNSTSNLYTPDQPISLRATGAQDYNVMASATGASSIQATFAATGASLSALTAGSLDIDVCLVSTP